MGSIDAGTVLADRYELLETAAAGATATVWAAHDEFLRRRVAVKILHDHLRTDGDLVARFAEEARHAAGVTHPNLVAVYDTIADPPALVMEWIDGPDLRRRLAAGPLSAEAAVALGVAVCDALATLHARGLVHRDVKPANLLLTAGGEPKLTDFGIATANAGDRTATGVVLGTAKYLAPEQVRGLDLDGRTDLFALACVLYEALAGQPPWARDGDLPTALARLEADPEPLTSRLPRLSPALAHVIDRGLALDPDDRWPTAEAFAAALRSTDTSPLPLPPPRLPSAPRPDPEPLRPRRRRGRGLAALVVLGAVAVLGVVLITQGGEKPPEQPAPAIFTALTFDPEGSGAPGENDALIGRAVDGNADTGWPTERYAQRTLGEKSGVGLVIVLEQVHDVHEVAILTDGATDWAADLRIATMSAADFDNAAEPGDFGPVVGGGTGLGESATLPASGRGNVVLVWITDLGEGTLPIRFVVQEASIR